MAYLNASISKDLYMQQIPGFESNNKQLVLKLHKALYRLKQSARAWNLSLSQALTGVGFRQGTADPCMFREQAGSSECYVFIFVDDLCFVFHDSTQLEWFICTTEGLFKRKHLGAVLL